MINKIKDGINLWTLRGKTNKNMRIVRPADINKIVDEANADISANTSAISANTSAITALGGQVSGTKFTKVLTESELDSLGTVGVEIMPTSGPTAFYDISKIRVLWDITGQQFTYSNTVDNRLWFTRGSGSNDLAFIDGTVINNLQKAAGVSNIVNATYLDLVNEIVPSMTVSLNQNVYLQLWNAANPTKGGAGPAIPTCTIEIWYDLVTIP